MTNFTSRHFIAAAAATTSLAIAPPASRAKQNLASASATSFSLPTLGYDFDALEPRVDAETIQLHYLKHHGAAVTALNDLAIDHPEITQRPIAGVLKGITSLPPTIRDKVANNLGSHANHSDVLGNNGAWRWKPIASTWYCH